MVSNIKDMQGGQSTYSKFDIVGVHIFVGVSVYWVHNEYLGMGQ